ncbi:universal stress protein [Steroidobacter agaridevorans]|uniref:universal stress protein n=1 Tax=Steroidobacter agaridevorans TaxID=2695856 RepID=UPI001379F8FD|nr:universal stress protein [Steroidobacter agaridevorans]
MTRLLCATDLLPKSERAIDRAGMLAEELGAELSLLHVVSPTASERVLEQSLQIAMNRMRSRARPPLWRHGSEPKIIVRTGNPARLICDTVAQEQSGLLVVGPHERRDVLEGLSGTIAEKVLAARKSPLLFVQTSADVSYRNVLFAVDLSAEAELAVRAAETLVLSRDARATAIHVCVPPLRGMVPSTTAALRATVAQRQLTGAIHDLLTRASADCSRYDVVVEEGHPIPALLRAVETHRPQLLVMGTRAMGRMRRALLGSVANQLLKEVVDCDVLVVPRIAELASGRACRPPAPGALLRH